MISWLRRGAIGFRLPRSDINYKSWASTKISKCYMQSINSFRPFLTIYRPPLGLLCEGNISCINERLFCVYGGLCLKRSRIGAYSRRFNSLLTFVDGATSSPPQSRGKPPKSDSGGDERERRNRNPPISLLIPVAMFLGSTSNFAMAWGVISFDAGRWLGGLGLCGVAVAMVLGGGFFGAWAMRVAVGWPP